MQDDMLDAAAADIDRAHEAIAEGDLARAEELGWSARATFAAATGDDHPDVANADLVLAEVARLRGDFATAAARAGRAYATMLLFEGEEHPAVPPLLVEAACAAADALRNLGELGRAVEVADQAVALAERYVGPESTQLASSLNLRGVVAKTVGRLDAAAEDYARARTLAQARGEPLLLASIDHNLCGLAHARGRYHDGLEPGRRAVDARIEALGEGHP